MDGSLEKSNNDDQVVILQALLAKVNELYKNNQTPNIYPPAPKDLEKIAKFFGVNGNWLEHGKEEAFSSNCRADIHSVIEEIEKLRCKILDMLIGATIIT